MLNEDTMVCPMPITSGSHIQLAHGGGGKLMHELIENVFLKNFDNPLLATRHDAALIHVPEGRIAFTTDSYVVKPLFFPGGDIGSLAVNGTVNDLCMGGARPLYLSVSFILEEGFPVELLQKVTLSMQLAAKAAGVMIVTGDTKVVDKGACDGLFINTAGIGIVETTQTISPKSVKPGDRIILSGDVGRHGMAIMSAREGIEFESTIQSDCAPLNSPVEALLKNGIEVHCLRDLTRGGLASALNEISSHSQFAIAIEQAKIPVQDQVQAACEILGYDPLYVANEGRFIVILPESECDRALSILHGFSLSENAAVIGHVTFEKAPLVTLRNSFGTERIVDMLVGEQLPRIC